MARAGGAEPDVSLIAWRVLQKLHRMLRTTTFALCVLTTSYAAPATRRAKEIALGLSDRAGDDLLKNSNSAPAARAIERIELEWDGVSGLIPCSRSSHAPARAACATALLTAATSGAP